MITKSGSRLEGPGLRPVVLDWKPEEPGSKLEPFGWKSGQPGWTLVASDSILGPFG